MRYYMHQGSFDFGFTVEDHSSNALLIIHPETKEAVQVTITRDRLASGEELESYVKRQYKVVGKKIPGYAELSRKDIVIGEMALRGLQMEARAKQDGFTVSQIQTIIVAPNNIDLLISTMGIPGPLTDSHRAWWTEVIASFNLPVEQRD